MCYYNAVRNIQNLKWWNGPTKKNVVSWFNQTAFLSHPTGSAALKEQSCEIYKGGEWEKDKRISSGSGSSHQSLLKWQIIFVHAENMPSGNPMPTMLRLPSVNKPPRQEVAFDSKSSALCTKPQCLANKLQNNKVSKILIQTKCTFAHTVRGCDRLMAMKDLPLKF